MTQSTSNTRFIHAPAEKIYQAFTDAKALESWLAPGDMTGKIHRFDWREGGGYEMSLYYPPAGQELPGKTSAMEDRYTARLIKLTPARQITQAIRFDSPDPRFAGEMILEVNFVEKEGGTDITFSFSNIPAGIRPEDNEKGTMLTLLKLAHFVEQARHPVPEPSTEIDEQCSDGSANAFEDK